MNYYKKNGIHIVEVPVEDFKIVMCDARKKSAAKQNYVNAGFFGSYAEGGQAFTLPVANLVCDYETCNSYVKKYCFERGAFTNDGKYMFDASQFAGHPQFYNKAITTLTIRDGKVAIEDFDELPIGLDYAISGVPVMRDGQDVMFNPYVLSQGWEASSLYGTWHTFVGLKKDCNLIYVMGMKTSSGNMVTSAEAYKKFKTLGLYDVIKLDGGGSFYMNVNGKAVASTFKNRRINTIITFAPGNENPYKVPTVALKKGNGNREYNRWLQWQLTFLGYECDVDGYFGPNTLEQVLRFQDDHGLVKDGSVGPATRAALLAK